MYGDVIAKELEARYPGTLDNDEEKWRGVILCILAAQVNFDNVEKIRGELFNNRTLRDIAAMSVDELYEITRHIRFGRVKAERVIKTANRLLEDYNGEVPLDRAYLETLPGIGRKNASVILSSYSDIPSIAVDTHVIRICARLGITDGTKDPKKVERAMVEYFDKSCWSRIHTQMMYFGRDVCKAQNPKCKVCPFSSFCPHFKK